MNAFENLSAPNSDKNETPKETQEPDTITRRAFLKKAAILAGAGALELAQGGPLRAATNMIEQTTTTETLDQTIEDEESIETSLQKWNAFKEILADGTVSENLEFLLTTFKNVNTGIDFKASWDIAGATDLMTKESELKEQGKSLTEDELSMSILQELVSAYEEFWNKDNLEQHIETDIEQHGLQSKVTGFEHLTNLHGEPYSNEKIITMLREMYPNQRWPFENIRTYKYDPSVETTETFTLAGTATERDIQNVLSAGREQIINIHGHPEGISEVEFKRLISHEIAHHHDWIGTLRLPMNERLQLFRDVTERFTSDHHHFSNYVEDVIPIDEHARSDKTGLEISQGRILNRQVVEFWAVINEEYDTEPERLQKYFPDDFDLVDRWRSKLSPSISKQTTETSSLQNENNHK